MAKISSSVPSPKKSRPSDGDTRDKASVDVGAKKTKGQGDSKAAGATKVKKTEPDRFVVEPEASAKAKSVGREPAAGAERITPSSTQKTAAKLHVSAGLNAEERRPNTSSHDGKTLHDPDDVKVKGKSTSVYTSATAARRGEPGKSASLEEAQRSAHAAVAEEKAAGKLKTSLDKEGVLRVKGSDKSDNITVERTGDALTVRSGGETLGSYAASEVRKVKVEARAGDDRVNVVGLKGTEVSLKTGRGADVARVIDTSGARVKTGRGEDLVELAGTKGALVNTGDGADIVRDVASRGLRVEAGGGDDRLHLTESLDSTVKGGAGRDKTVLTDVDHVQTTHTRVLAQTSPAPTLASSPPETPSVQAPAAPSKAHEPGGVMGRTAAGLPSQGTSVPSPLLPTPKRGLGTAASSPGGASSTRPTDLAPSLPSPSPPVLPPAAELPPPRHEDVLDFIGARPGDLGAGTVHPGTGRPPVSVGHRNDPVVARPDPAELAPPFGSGAFSPSPGPGTVAASDDDDDALRFRP